MAYDGMIVFFVKSVSASQSSSFAFGVVACSHSRYC
jgi:hypothetical protein